MIAFQFLKVSCIQINGLLDGTASHLRSLKILDLSSNEFEEILKNAFKGLENLKALILNKSEHLVYLSFTSS